MKIPSKWAKAYTQFIAQEQPASPGARISSDN